MERAGFKERREWTGCGEGKGEENGELHIPRISFFSDISAQKK